MSNFPHADNANLKRPQGRQTVWIFCGRESTFPSGVFDSKHAAEAWIHLNQLSGTLTEYPVGLGVYDWAVEEGHFKPTKPEHSQPKFIQRFSSALQNHHHYENGS